MDPVTSAIVAAIVEGVTSKIIDMGKKPMAESYQALKALLKKKFGPYNKPYLLLNAIFYHQLIGFFIEMINTW